MITRWEYRRSSNLSETEMTAYGNLGWELVNVVSISHEVFMFWKRPS
jgi:hypothetical protein